MRPRNRSAELQLGALVILLAVLMAGCRTVPPLPPADFSAPGWLVREGQAVWKPSKTRPALAGELLLATQTNGNFLIQFSKPPFDFATAQVIHGQWQIEFGDGQRRWRGRGNPPTRFAWFQLPRALAGEGLASPWRFLRPTADSWRLENSGTGESLEGGFFP